nr:MAG TPA: hypothetical protein [Caudoviricetes sp.]
MQHRAAPNPSFLPLRSQTDPVYGPAPPVCWQFHRAVLMLNGKATSPS